MITTPWRRSCADGQTPPYEQIVIAAVGPAVDGGRHPVKAVVGDVVTVEATVFRHGHDRVRAALHWQRPGEPAPVRQIPMTLTNPGLDLWQARLPLEQLGRYRFTVSGWTDVYASWVEELTKRVRAAQADIGSEVAAGLALVEQMAADSTGETQQELNTLLARLRAAAGEPARLLAVAAADEAMALMATSVPRPDEVRYEPELEVIADRPRARVGAWYELFIRSQGTDPAGHGTFRDAQQRLAGIHRLGFDVIYLAPIHPIGTSSRKGRNNSLSAGPDDPGSPWAIGSQHGGHDAIEPALGTLADFDALVQAAGALDLEIALDFAVQCSPDHPWVTAHPEWFYRRPDGTIRYAENPPKKYEDIYPLNFESRDWQGLWEALREVMRFWISHGVRIFRVDNPHTKPIGFWAWLIASIQAEHPDVLFLAEAFTRPAMMEALARRGFSQSYTYFTWRNTKAEITEYLTELTDPQAALTFRPNFFANTPDILPPILQDGGPAAFKSRLALAATLSPTYGIYSGYELCEHAAIPGREEYLDSEKYQVKVRDWNAPGNINEFIMRINRARRANPALQQFTNLRFLTIDNDRLLAYVKWVAEPGNWVIVVVNLDPFASHTGTLQVPPEALGLAAGTTFEVLDLLTDARYVWGEQNFVSLDPLAGEPVHLLRVQ